MLPEVLLQALLMSQLSPKEFAAGCGISIAELVAMVGGELEIPDAIDRNAEVLASEGIRRFEHEWLG